VIAHIVLFEPKPEVTPEQRRDFLQSIRDAARRIPAIRNARIGKTFNLYQMPEVSHGQATYSFSAVFEFDDKAGLQSYLTHQVHDRVRLLFWQLCSSTLIVDVELIEPSDESADKLVN